MLKIKEYAPSNPEVDVVLENGVELHITDFDGINDRYLTGWKDGERDNKRYYPVYDDRNEFSIIGYEKESVDLTQY